MRKKISIIVPVYNKGKYLDKCISSIVNQSYENIEIILINDGSTDESLDICNVWKQNDSRIIVLDQENNGVSAARNRGIDYSSGDYIAFIDGDDWIDRNYISYLLYLCNTNECDVSQVRYRYVENENEINLSNEKDNVVKISFYELFSSSNRLYRAIVCGKLFAKYLFDEYRFPVGRIYEDEEAAFYLTYKAKNIALSNRQLYYYRMTDNSIMRNDNTRVNFDFVYLHERIINYLEKVNDYKVLLIERKEFCIRLMMNYCSLNYEKAAKDDKQNLLRQFKKQFNLIDNWNKVSLKETCALKLFSLFPDLFAFLERNIGFIKKVKVKRVQSI